MAKYRYTVHELTQHPDGVTAVPDIKVLEVVVDRFEPTEFMKAISAAPRRRRKAKAESAS